MSLPIANLALVQRRADLAILVEGDQRLFNQYGIMLVNPQKHRA
jgi:tungstate transport system substrate-binding protein